MKLLLLFGSGAVGKMTVGQELCKTTNFKLFHNHMSIEPVIEVFGYRDNNVVNDFRKSVFKNFAKSKNYGLIFTFIWDFEAKSDWKFVKKITNYYKRHKAEVYFVELVADLETRLKRNETENRLINKASKRDIKMSKQRIITENEHRLVSFENEITFKNYIKIDNTNLTAEEAAKLIKEKFNF